MPKENSAASTSLLSKSVSIEGEIKGKENLHIDGSFNGSIKLDGDVLVGTHGIVDAEIEANNVVIQGKVTGNVIAHQQLEIQRSGKLMGDCTARSIDIKEGALFEGRSSMLKAASDSSQPASAGKKI
jgi:cytoskeletal protein CcmA (bactofilin family)